MVCWNEDNSRAQEEQWSTGKRYFDMTAYWQWRDSGGRLRTDRLTIGLCQKGKVQNLSDAIRSLIDDIAVQATISIHS